MTTTEITKYDGPFVSTWFQDSVDVSYERIVEVFGEPEDCTGDDKVDAEWKLMTPAGIATIYNYKSGQNYLGASGQPTAMITDWHIGGTTDAVVPFIQKALLDK